MNIIYCEYNTTKAPECKKTWEFSFYANKDGRTLCNATVLYNTCPNCLKGLCVLSKEKTRTTNKHTVIGGLVLLDEESFV